MSERSSIGFCSNQLEILGLDLDLVSRLCDLLILILGNFCFSCSPELLESFDPNRPECFELDLCLEVLLGDLLCLLLDLPSFVISSNRLEILTLGPYPSSSLSSIIILAVFSVRGFSAWW